MSIYKDVIDLEQMYFEAETQEDTEAAQELLEEVLNIGLEKLCKVRANKGYRIDALKAEEERIKKQRQAEEKQLSRIEDYMLNLLERVGGKATAGSFKLSIRDSKAVIIDETTFFTKENDNYITQKIEYKADKIKLKGDLNEGVIIVGATLKTNKNLQVK